MVNNPKIVSHSKVSRILQLVSYLGSFIVRYACDISWLLSSWLLSSWLISLGTLLLFTNKSLAIRMVEAIQTVNCAAAKTASARPTAQTVPRQKVRLVMKTASAMNPAKYKAVLVMSTAIEA